jgi:hypothetical protein
MYHIKNDKRSQTSAKLISEGLYKCLEKKIFFDITITDVQHASGTGRATFYRLFDNLSDVLVYQCDKIFADIVYKYKDLKNNNPDDYFITFIKYWMTHDKLLETIVNCNRTDILFNAQYNSIDNFKIFFSELNIDESKFDYFLSFLTSVLTSVLSTWIKHGRKETPQEIYQNVQDSSKLFYSMMIKD